MQVSLKTNMSIFPLSAMASAKDVALQLAGTQSMVICTFIVETFGDHTGRQEVCDIKAIVVVVLVDVVKKVCQLCLDIDSGEFAAAHNRVHHVGIQDIGIVVFPRRDNSLDLEYRIMKK